jgi:large subunit ribosomal protein L25
VAIAIDGDSETALVKGIQRDPRSAQILHIEFQAVSLNESVTSTVPLRFVGESEAVTKLDGVLSHPRSEVHITARARDLPDVIEVDLSSLTELHAAIKVSDLPTSGAYTVVDSPDEVLAIVLAPKVEAEEVPELTEEAAAAAAEAPTEEAGETAEAAEESAASTDDNEATA